MVAACGSMLVAPGLQSTGSIVVVHRLTGAQLLHGIWNHLQNRQKTFFSYRKIGVSIPALGLGMLWEKTGTGTEKGGRGCQNILIDLTGCLAPQLATLLGSLPLWSSVSHFLEPLSTTEHGLHVCVCVSCSKQLTFRFQYIVIAIQCIGRIQSIQEEFQNSLMLQIQI